MKDYRTGKKRIFTFKKDLANFIKYCMDDAEFWLDGGIPYKEEYYIKKYNMTEEQVHRFYTAMCDLKNLNRELNIEQYIIL